MDFLLHHMLRTSASRAPEKEALVHGQRRVSYASLAGEAASLGQGLREAGCRRGDRIGLYLEHSAPLVVSIFGTSEAGGVFVPINHLLFPDQVAHIANDCGMRGLVTTARRLAGLAEVLPTIPSLEFVVVVGDAEMAEVPQATLDFDDLVRRTPPRSGRDESIGLDLAALLYTSGSTGKPKGVMVTHAQVMAGASIVSDYLAITAADRIASVLPLSFDAGLNQVTTAVQQGATVVLTPFVFARDIVQMLRRERITGLAGVPTLWSLLAQPNSTLQNHAYPDLRYITNTGGAMPQEVLAALRTALPATKIFLMYGLTEAFRSTYLPPEELDRRPTSIGKAIPNTEILVVDERGEPCRPGEVGELVHRGPTVSNGYWGRPDLTAERLRPHPFLPPEQAANEWVCYSGDLVTRDEEGFLYFVGRRDTMIKSSGFRISPTEVEALLHRSGQVRDAAVVGVPDPVLGQAIRAFVVPAEGATLDPDALVAFCGAHAPRYMVPAGVEILPELPKTGSGKVDYPALRRRAGG